jgi:hypothetical protein
MTRPQECPCGSGLRREDFHDGHDFLFCACAVCFDKKRAKYRHDIFKYRAAKLGRVATPRNVVSLKKLSPPQEEFWDMVRECMKASSRPTMQQVLEGLTAWGWRPPPDTQTLTVEEAVAQAREILAKRDPAIGT